MARKTTEYKGLALALTLVLALWGAAGKPGRLGIILCCAGIAACVWYQFWRLALGPERSVAEKIARSILLAIVAAGGATAYGWQYWPSNHTHVAFEAAELTGNTYFNTDRNPGISLIFRNTGNTTVQDHKLRGVATVLRPSELSDAMNKLRPEILQKSSYTGGDLPAGSDPLFRSFHMSLTNGDVAALNSTDPQLQKAFCGLGILFWKDESGSYETDVAQCYFREKSGQWALHPLPENNHETTLR